MLVRNGYARVAYIQNENMLYIDEMLKAEDKAKKEAQTIAEQSRVEVKSIKDKAMANVDEAASIIVKNIL
mgnify:CR=1 FL=1